LVVGSLRESGGGGPGGGGGGSSYPALPEGVTCPKWGGLSKMPPPPLRIWSTNTVGGAVAGEVHSRLPLPPRINNKEGRGWGRVIPSRGTSPPPRSGAHQNKMGARYRGRKGGAGVSKVHSGHRPPIPRGGKRGTRPKACVAPHPRKGRWRERVFLLRRHNKTRQ